MNLFQLVFLAFILISLYKIGNKIKTGQLNVRESFIWVFAWVFGAIIIFNPSLSAKISSVFGIGRGADLVVYSSIIFIYYISYRIYLKIDNLQKQIKELSTKIALKDKS